MNIAHLEHLDRLEKLDLVLDQQTKLESLLENPYLSKELRTAISAELLSLESLVNKI